MLLEMVAEVYFFLSLPGFQVILTFHICNNKKKKKKKEVYNCVVQMNGEGGNKIQCAIIQKPWRLS